MTIYMIGPGHRNRFLFWSEDGLIPSSISDYTDSLRNQGWVECGWWRYFWKGIFPLVGR